MRMKISAAIMATLFIVCPVWADDDFDQDEAAVLRQQGVIQPLENILRKANQLHSGRVMEVELKKQKAVYVYEIEIVDATGHVWEMQFNAQTAALMSQKQEH
jgi:uncharacterized membrane protein YkoI